MAVMHILTTSSSTQTVGVTTFKESGSSSTDSVKQNWQWILQKLNCHATVTFLGHLVGQGQVKPLEAKVNAISEFPVPKCKRQLMRFLGMAGTIGNSVKISQVLLNL